MTNGQLVLNGVTDQELDIVLQQKIKHEGAFTFNPQPAQQFGGQRGTYNNVTLAWATPEGLTAILGIVEELAKPLAPAATA